MSGRIYNHRTFRQLTKESSQKCRGFVHMIMLYFFFIFFCCILFMFHPNQNIIFARVTMRESNKQQIYIFNTIIIPNLRQGSSRKLPERYYTTLNIINTLIQYTKLQQKQPKKDWLVIGKKYKVLLFCWLLSVWVRVENILVSTEKICTKKIRAE